MLFEVHWFKGDVSIGGGGRHIGRHLGYLELLKDIRLIFGIEVLRIYNPSEKKNISVGVGLDPNISFGNLTSGFIFGCNNRTLFKIMFIASFSEG